MPGLNSGLARVPNVQTLGPSADTGPIILEAKYWTKWLFTVTSTGVITGGQLTFYGVTDPATAGVIGIPGSSTASPKVYDLLEAPANAAGVVNPITAFDGSQSMKFDMPLLAVRFTTNAYTGGGTITVRTLVTP